MLRPAPAMAVLPWLAACDLLAADDTAGPATVSWIGQVLDGPYTGENGPFTGGSFEVADLADEPLAEGEEPWADEPGTWRVEVPPDLPVAIHLAGEGLLAAAWRGTTPSADAYWFTGALFAYDEATWLPFFEQFEEAGVEVGSLGPDACWFWGAPSEPEAWAGADVALTDGAGAPAALTAWHVDDDGYLVEAADEPVDYLIAFGLAPGDLVLTVETADDRVLTETWPSRGGEVVTGWFLALPEEG